MRQAIDTNEMARLFRSVFPPKFLSELRKKKSSYTTESPDYAYDFLDLCKIDRIGPLVVNGVDLEYLAKRLKINELYLSTWLAKPDNRALITSIGTFQNDYYADVANLEAVTNQDSDQAVVRLMDSRVKAARAIHARSKDTNTKESDSGVINFIYNSQVNMEGAGNMKLDLNDLKETSPVLNEKEAIEHQDDSSILEDRVQLDAELLE